MPNLKYIAVVVFLGCLGAFIAQVGQVDQSKERPKEETHPDIELLLQKTTRLTQEKKYDSLLIVGTEGESIVVEHQLDSFYLSAFRNQQGSAYYHQENFVEAIKIYNWSLEATTDDETGLNQKGNILYDRANAEYYLGMHKTSYETSLAAEAVLSKLSSPDYDFLISVYFDLSYNSRKLGFYNRSEEFLNKAASVNDLHGNEIVYISADPVRKSVTIEYSYILLYANSGEEVKLIAHLNELEKLVSSPESGPLEHLRYVSALIHVGDHFLSNNLTLENDSAIEKGSYYLSKAHRLLDHDKYKQSSTQLQFNSIKALILKQEFAAALRMNESLFSRMSANDSREPYFLAQRAIILQNLGRISEANQTFWEIITKIHQGKDTLKSDYSNFSPSPNLGHASFILAIADTLNRIDDDASKKMASSFYTCGLNLFNYNFSGLNFNEKLTKTYNGLLKGSMLRSELDNNDLKQLINQSESIENQLLWAEYEQNRAHKSFNIPDSIQEREYELRFLLTQYRRDGNEQLCFQTEREIEKHAVFVKKNYPSYAKFSNGEFDVSEFQKGLDKDALVLRFFQFKDVLFRLTISKSTLDLTQLDDAESLQKKITNYTALIREGKANKTLASTLAKQLLPLKMKNYGKLTFIANGTISNLPFETLVNENEYLVFSHSISYAPHLIFLQSGGHEKSSENQRNELVVFSPSYNDGPLEILNGAQNESEVLTKQYNGSLFQGTSATRKKFLNLPSNTSILHLSMHAKIDQKNSTNSCLYFQDNSFFIEELYGLNLSADLVVLSACSTGDKMFGKNHGSRSLQRAFIYAGVSSTISSLWEVPDEATSKVMLSFYEFLENGLSKSEALRNAKINYLETTSDPHLTAPYYWAGFVISGDVSPVKISKKSATYWSYLIWGIFVLLLTAILYWIYYYNKKQDARLRSCC